MSRTPFVWVRRDYVPIERPGLVLEWRRDAEGWLALVTYLEHRPDRIVTEWVRPTNLRPVPAAPKVGSAYDGPGEEQTKNRP